MRTINNVQLTMYKGIFVMLILLLFNSISFAQQKKNEITKQKAEIVLAQTSDIAVFRKVHNNYVYNLYKYKIVSSDTTLILLATDRTPSVNDLTQADKDILDGKTQ